MFPGFAANDSRGKKLTLFRLMNDIREWDMRTHGQADGQADGQLLTADSPVRMHIQFE